MSFKQNNADSHLVAKTFKIIIIGDANVGKTCLTMRICNGTFPQKTESTIGVDFKEKIVKVQDELIKLQFWDSAGQERFRHSLVPHYYRNVHAVVFVYDVTKKSSFQNLSKWLEEFQVNVNANLDIPRVIIGNKCDLHANREVSSSEANMVALNFGIELWETSAKSEFEVERVEQIFQNLAETLKFKSATVEFPPSLSRVNAIEQSNGLKITNSSYDLSSYKKTSKYFQEKKQKKCCGS
ncbi:putative Ras-related protein Rab-33 [Hydra vulgaris]|uniref:Ras-related protein Rab-33 n=1 Tax=Hydra vulgaris TaxID=6087 RepID=A0ABM4D7J6_HYDVU